MDFRIIHHHIGARGNVPLPLDRNSPIRKDFSVYYYDADENALTNTLRSLVRVGETTLLPYCLGARRERRTFHIANDAYASSLYRFNARYAAFTKAVDLGQLTMGESHAAAREIEVDVVPLDEICGPGHEIPAPDYLSIDAEGAEFEVLHGASRVLEDSVLWLRSEMWMHPVYEGTESFATSFGFIQQAGFELFEIEPYGQYEAERMVLGMHSTGQTLGAEVSFHRRISDLTDAVETDRAAVILKLYKLALLAILHGGNGLCYRALKLAKALGGSFFAEVDGTVPAKYLDFLRDLWSRFESMSGYLPVLPDFSSYMHARRQRQFTYSNATDENVKRSLVEQDNAARQEVADRFSKDLERLNRLMWSTTTSFEGCLLEYGLVEQAKKVREKRQMHCENFIKKYYLLSGSSFR